MTEPNDAAPTQDQQQADDSGKQQQHNKIQTRINELWGQKKQAEEHASSLASEVESLRTQLAETQEKLNLLGVQRQAGSDPLFPSSPAVQSSSGEDLEKTVRKVLGETVGPFMQTWQQQQKLAQLRAAQAQSFTRAKTEFSDLGDPNSPLFQTADEIMRRDQMLATDPDGPRKAAIMARGLLADTGQETVAPERKIAAAQPATASAGPDTTPSDSKQLEAARAELDQVLQQMQKARDPKPLWAKRNEIVQRIMALEGRVGV